MRKTLLCLTLVFCGALVTFAQSTQCPQGQVCLDQATANDIYKKPDELVAAKDAINKMLAERNASDAAINAANMLIESYKQQDAVNGQIVLKYKDAMAMYEQVVKMQQQVIDSLTKRLNAPKSTFAKVMTVIKEIGILLAGVTIGRGL